ncbi:hypothetical protein AB0N14_33280 [Streptomyces sp. NPDC051104]|uniref:hypothetical protein n=1 Tax=Streptomyces sp. NPDC051104 TaxID=3155044 RepID=UPI00343D17A5
MSGRVVGTYVHAYDVPRRQSYQPIHSGAATQAPSATPIYDALYAEYVRAFRACPGDRSGEEELGFTAFSASPQHGTGHLAAQHGHTASAASVWQQVARHARRTHHVLALPPAPRRGL